MSDRAKGGGGPGALGSRALGAGRRWRGWARGVTRKSNPPSSVSCFVHLKVGELERGNIVSCVSLFIGE